MILERIEAEGLAHYSYLLGVGGDAVIIDPRRDIDVYLEFLARTGLRLRHVLETHRNEDYLSGSNELGERTGAQVWHADVHLDYQYGTPVEPGHRWKLDDRLEVEALATAGHTPGHTSYLLRAQDGTPWMLFSGDCLFAGDVGRTDLLGPDRLEDLTRTLHQTLQSTVLPLGDHVLLLPAHGSGSACGGAIADRPHTTIGLERTLNPLLELAEEEFVRRQARMLERPPYFDKMERGNLRPGGLVGTPVLTPLDPCSFAERAAETLVLDTRQPPAYLASHVPGALSVWAGGVAGWAGWFLPYEEPVLLVTDEADRRSVHSTLLRMGFDPVSGFLDGGMHSWHTAGLETASSEAVSVPELGRRFDADEGLGLLDVRSDEEVAERAVPSAAHIPLAELPERLEEVPSEGRLYVFCGSGLRSTVAASLLERAGRTGVAVVLGGVEGWKSARFPLT